jgi:hypothetical protein
VNQFASNVERHRRELLIHCYRMLGSLPDAQDAQSLDSAEGNTRIVCTKPQDEIVRLKQEQGKNILIGG